MNQKIKIGIWLVAFIAIIGVIVSTNSIYKFKVDKLLKSKECKVTSYSIKTINATDYCEDLISPSYIHIASKEKLFQYDTLRRERDRCINNTNIDRKIILKGESDCYTDTNFDFLIFRTSDNKVVSKGFIWAGADGFSKYVDTSIPNVGDLVLTSEGHIDENAYQVLFK